MPPTADVRTVKKLAVPACAIVLAGVTLTGCMNKANEPFKDSGRSGTNNKPAEVITFPDGFNNAATKCDNGNRVYVIYHGDHTYGSVAVVPNDPTCANGN